MNQLGKNGLLNNFAGGAQTNGILFNFPKGQQYTSYATGDEGYRVQNGFFDISQPTNPAAIPKLNYSLGANYWYEIDIPLTVGGVSSKTRFVDVNGVQGWGVANNVIDLLIDKYTGLGLYRNYLALPAATTWANSVAACRAFSDTVNGVLYPAGTFYMPSLEEYMLIGGHFNYNGWADPITGQLIVYNPTGKTDFWAATTNAINILNGWSINPNPQLNIRSWNKLTPGVGLFAPPLFDARSLISI